MLATLAAMKESRGLLARLRERYSYMVVCIVTGRDGLITRCFMQMVSNLSSHNFIFMCLGFNSARVVDVQGIAETKRSFFHCQC